MAPVDIPEPFVQPPRSGVVEPHGTERERLWKLMAEIWPAYDHYQRKTDRLIPVVIHERAAS